MLSLVWVGYASLRSYMAKKVGYTIMLIPDLIGLVLYIWPRRGELALFSVNWVVQLGS